MLMLWMCCLSFAQEEKNERGLPLIRPVHPAETPPCCWRFRSLQSRVIGWRAHNFTPLPLRNVICGAFVVSLVCERRSCTAMVVRERRRLTRRFIGTSDSASRREDWMSSFIQLRQGHPLVNMEDRMLDRFADHQS